MNLDRLARLEDLTRRYAKHRPCGAGLGMLWGGLVYQFFAGLVLGWVLRQVEPSATLKDLARALFRAQMKTPVFLEAAAIATPLAVWLGVFFIQRQVDRRFGVVAAEPATGQAILRWFMPGFVILLAGLHLAMGVFHARVLFPHDPAYAADPMSLSGTVAIAALALLWGRSRQDAQTRSLMILVSFLPLFILRPGPADLFVFTAASAAYLLLMFGIMALGALRFAGFLKVSGELSAIRPEGE